MHEPSAASGAAGSPWSWTASTVSAPRLPIAPDCLIEAPLGPTARRFFDRVIDALEEGPGFVLVERIPVERLSYDEVRALVLRLAGHLGQPIRQDAHGTLLYDLVDTSVPGPGGEDHPGSRRVDLPFHTDNAWGRVHPDRVGSFCLRPAKEGGALELVSVQTIIDEMGRSSPRLVAALERPVFFDRRGRVTHDEEAIDAMPIVAWRTPSAPTFRYLHRQIDPDRLLDDQVEAIAAIERLLARPELALRIALRPGELLLIDNHRVLHRRTRFENDTRPRHHMRIWLARSQRAG